MPANNPAIRSEEGTDVVRKALLRAQSLLSLSNKELAAIIGISEPSASRLKKEQSPYLLQGKNLELAVIFLRLYRSLDSIIGGEDPVAAKWLRAHNNALGAPPIEKITTISGLLTVLDYLDARRAII